jgi:hypothetical protein
MELKSPLNRSGSWEKATVTVLPPDGNGMAAVPGAAGHSPDFAVGVGGTAMVAGATVVGVGPQDARIRLANATSDTSKNIERFTISLLSKYGKTEGWVLKKKQK